ncbi:unnamed protein product [Orchesella dallaii]|uniref:NADH dehydrogenase [ubiquinone] 1 alpha subcomplex subunit 7 n=1 Tax=Orchesella dallaii TaxID=48710 RepID=A0ABP1R783_9HEXA
MADKIKVRNISPLLQVWRNFLLGRKHVPERAALRYSPLVSARDQPPPNFPEGEFHQLSANPYCKRDGRREAAPPILVLDNNVRKQIAAGSAVEGQSPKGPVTPGKYWQWD